MKNWTKDILDAHEPPQVFSVSYGIQGNVSADKNEGCSEEITMDIEDDFAKIFTLTWKVAVFSKLNTTVTAFCGSPHCMGSGLDAAGTFAEFVALKEGLVGVVSSTRLVVGNSVQEEAPIGETCSAFPSRSLK